MHVKLLFIQIQTDIKCSKCFYNLGFVALILGNFNIIFVDKIHIMMNELHLHRALK